MKLEAGVFAERVDVVDGLAVAAQYDQARGGQVAQGGAKQGLSAPGERLQAGQVSTPSGPAQPMAEQGVYL
ncbi:hypothetical protein GA0070622_0001, partial [Micromonospora sediminicola]